MIYQIGFKLGRCIKNGTPLVWLSFGAAKVKRIGWLHSDFLVKTGGIHKFRACIIDTMF